MEAAGTAERFCQPRFFRVASLEHSIDGQAWHGLCPLLPYSQHPHPILAYFVILSFILFTLKYVCLLLFSCSVKFNFFATPWTVACQAFLSMKFSKQEYWSGLPFLTLEDLPNPGIEPASFALGGGSFTTEPPEKLCKDERTDYSRCDVAAARGSGQASSGETGENHAERKERAVQGETQMACAKVLW